MKNYFCLQAVCVCVLFPRPANDYNSHSTNEGETGVESFLFFPEKIIIPVKKEKQRKKKRCRKAARRNGLMGSQDDGSGKRDGEKAFLACHLLIKRWG